MIEYEEDWLFTLLPRVSGSVFIGASCFALPAVVFCVLMLFCDDWEPGWREEHRMYDLAQSVLWSVSTAVLGTLLGFRTNTAFRRFWEGTGLLHQMRGEWFDTVSNCVTFSISARKSEKQPAVDEFRHTLVRLMSLCHGSALEEIADNQIQLESIDSYGLDDGTLLHLKECHNQYHFNKVEVMLHLVQSLITNAHDNGVLKIPPPILSRVYQTISRGFVNLLNAKKITDTKFPFPYAQLISFLLLSHTILTPMMMSVVIRSKILAGIFTFLPIFGMACLNLTAIQLENPFGTDDNDLPLEHFQTEMNSCLLMLLHPNTDMIAGTSPRCIKNFQGLLGSMASHRHSVGATEEAVLPAMRLSNFEAQDPVVVEKEQSATEDVYESVVIQTPMKHEVPTEATDNKWRKLGARRQLSQEPDRKVLEQRADELHVHLMKKMTDFNDHLMRWSQLVENQVIQLTQSFDSLKTFSEQIQFPQAQGLSGVPAASGGVPGQQPKMLAI